MKEDDFSLSFFFIILFLPWKLFGEENKISSDPHKLCIIFLVLSQRLCVTLVCHPVTHSSSDGGFSTSNHFPVQARLAALLTPSCVL